MLGKIPDLAELLSISSDAAYKMVRRVEIPGVIHLPGATGGRGRIRVDLDRVREWIAAGCPSSSQAHL